MADGTRTRGHRDHNPELYQLSYRHLAGFIVAAACGEVAAPAEPVRHPIGVASDAVAPPSQAGGVAQAALALPPTILSTGGVCRSPEIWTSTTSWAAGFAKK